MNKLYTRIVWENFPSEKTALNESNLNRMDLALDNIDNRVIEMDSTKVNVETANTLIKNWTMDEGTGVITVEKLNGEKIIFDLNIEKIPVNFELSEDGIMTMTTDDGTQYTANIGAMIPVLTFEDSDEIAVSVTGSGVNKTYSFSIKAGSVTEDKMQPNFLADVKTEVAKAQASQSAAADSASAASNIATMAESYTHGGTGAREGEETDNAKYYMEQAKAVSAVDIMTVDKAGIGKPDGTTITVDEDGTLHGQSKVNEMTGATADKDGTSGTVPAPTAGQENLFLRGDGTWAKASGGSSIAPKATVDPAISSGNSKVAISWGDPEDVVLDGAVLSAWKGTKLVMKESGYPENENDGTLILDNTVRDAYKTSGYVVDGLTNGNTYYFALFPYSTDGVYNYSASNRLLGNPSLVKLDSCTNMQISAAMGSVTVTWDDPDATKTVDGNTATWAKTVLVYKQGSVAPNSPADGTMAVTETTRNQYASVGYEVTGLTDGKQYTFALFAISTDETSSDAVSATAKLWATLTVNTTEDTLFGKTVTATNEVKTVSGTFSDSGSATLQIPWIGLTTVTSTDGTDTADDTVDVTAYMATYSTQITFIPDGETVTPIDDVSILLKCAGIKDKNYTTMEEVLADDEVMSDITMDENSMKYLARSTGFADDVCANETFMTFLGQSTYVDDTVLNSDLWYQKCLDSQYYQLVFLDVLKLSDLPVGALIQDDNTKYNDSVIVWKKMESNHTGDPDNSTALVTDKIIALKCFDAKEPSNSDSNRRQYGNNRYLYSNIRQWLNSSAVAGAWYVAQHSADAAPTNANVWTNYNEYDQEAGFLTNFSEQMKAELLTVTKRVAKNTVTDGGGYEDVTQKIFLLSNTEVGLANENSIAEGSLYALFNTASERLAYPTAQAVSMSEYSDNNLAASKPWYWWLRTPDAGSSYYARFVITDGTLSHSHAYDGSNGVRPACVVSSSILVSKTPTSDGVYRIIW